MPERQCGPCERHHCPAIKPQSKNNDVVHLQHTPPSALPSYCFTIVILCFVSPSILCKPGRIRINLSPPFEMGGRKSDVAVTISSPAEPRRSRRKRNLVEESDQGIAFDEPPLKKSAGKRRLMESNDNVLNPLVMTKKLPSVGPTKDTEAEVSKPEMEVQKKPKKRKAEREAGTDPTEEKRLRR